MLKYNAAKLNELEGPIITAAVAELAPSCHRKADVMDVVRTLRGVVQSVLVTLDIEMEQKPISEEIRG